MHARIRVVIESQPRSGTHYTLNNLIRALGLEYATVFEGELESDKKYFAHGSFREANLFCATPDPARPQYAGHVAKSHFFHQVELPAGQEQAPFLYLLSYFFDCYYSFGWILTDMAQKPYEQYVLRHDSPEWEKLAGRFIPAHLTWLDRLEGPNRERALRYEDYAVDFNAALDRLQRIVAVFDPTAFAPFKPKVRRSYFSGEYAAQMDSEVFTALQKTFKDYIRAWYPERASVLSL